LASNGVPVDLTILSKVGHSFEPDRATVIRVIGEYCKAMLMPDHPQPEFTQPHPIRFMVCSLPAFLWLGSWHYIGRKRRKTADEPLLTRLGIGLRVTIIVLTTLVLAQTALHLILLLTEVSERTLKIARNHVVPAQWKEDFEVLATQPIWKGQKLGTLLTHVEPANYTVREIINWQLDNSIYRNFVLSPPIAPSSDIELNWRRPLWEFYYPRIRGEQTITAATAIVARTLRERITIWPGKGTNTSISDN